MTPLLKYVFTRLLQLAFSHRLSLADVMGILFIGTVFRDEPFNVANVLLFFTLCAILVATTSYLRGLLGADE